MPCLVSVNATKMIHVVSTQMDEVNIPFSNCVSLLIRSKNNMSIGFWL